MICKRHWNHTGKWWEVGFKRMDKQQALGKATKFNLKHGNILGANERK